MDEKTALSLSGLKDKDSFLQAVKDGDPVFPSVLSAKIVRKLKRVSQEDATNAQPDTTYVNNHTIEVSRQDAGITRTTTCLSLIAILRTSASMSSAILPVSLSMLKYSKVYPLLVQYPIDDIPQQPCKKICVLIKASKKSICTEQEPFQVITEDVEDMLDASENIANQPHAQTKYKLIIMCTKDNQSALRLSPAHGKQVYALAVITAVHGTTLIAENVETVEKGEKEQLVKAMKQEMRLATELLKHTANGSFVSWNETTSPLTSSRCRELSRSPTGPELDVMDIQVSKKPQIE